MFQYLFTIFPWGHESKELADVIASRGQGVMDPLFRHLCEEEEEEEDRVLE